MKKEKRNKEENKSVKNEVKERDGDERAERKHSGVQRDLFYFKDGPEGRKERRKDKRREKGRKDERGIR